MEKAQGLPLSEGYVIKANHSRLSRPSTLPNDKDVIVAFMILSLFVIELVHAAELKAGLVAI